MKKFEYKYVEVAIKISLKTKAGDTFEKCKKIIDEEAENGWRLKQILPTFNEKMSVYMVTGYQIIFEKIVE